ncbi:hemolysin family protein [Campylobacter ureolyticus]|uniref:hemolysin family protein n=1 Tax=Campylobacter ureolyticus TaxID=827 RepID=UPI00215A7553|nr:hemolysin family protein [Campylobacter ureolyticus]MCR8700302.1 hemolysin family protein [Campylobacter ureolyticus]MCZ6168738.1 hemolysin family protein [Campylobacter ureolyticus]
MLILAFVFVLLNAFFVLSEFAIVKIRKSKLEELSKDGVKNAKMAYEITNSLDSYLSATQLGITISSLALGWIGEPAVAMLIEKPINSIFEANATVIHSISFIISFTFITLLHVVLGELVPKSVAIATPEKSVLFVAKPLHAFWVIFKPFIAVFDFLAGGILKLIGIRPAGENEIAHSEEEIKIIVAESLKGGVLDSIETQIIKNAVDFSDTVAKEIMTPRKQMVCLNAQKSYEENYKRVIESKYTRFPYIDGSKDSVLGMIHIRDILQSDKKDFNKIVRRILIVPENSSIASILSMMNKERISAALVIDEYGGTSGLITMEDIIEEVLGDINDEHDESEVKFRSIKDGIYELVGTYEIEDFEEITGVDFDDNIEEITIGGYVFNLIGRLPKAGDKTEDENFIYEVLKMDGNIIQTLKAIKKEKNKDDEE